MPIIIRHEPVGLIGPLAGRAAQSAANEQTVQNVQDIARTGLAAQAGVNNRTDAMVGLMQREQDRQALEQYRQQQVAEREAARQADMQRALLQQNGLDARSQAATDRMLQGILLRDELARQRDAEQTDAGASVYPGAPLSPQPGAVAPRRRAIGGGGAAVTPDSPDADPKDLLNEASAIEKTDPGAAHELRKRAMLKRGIAPIGVRHPDAIDAGKPQEQQTLDAALWLAGQLDARAEATEKAAGTSTDPAEADRMRAAAAAYRRKAGELVAPFVGGGGVQATPDPLSEWERRYYEQQQKVQAGEVADPRGWIDTIRGWAHPSGGSAAATPVTTATATVTPPPVPATPSAPLPPEQRAAFAANRDPAPAPDITLNRVEILPKGTILPDGTVLTTDATLYFDERIGGYVRAPQGAPR